MKHFRILLNVAYLLFLALPLLAQNRYIDIKRPEYYADLSFYRDILKLDRIILTDTSTFIRATIQKDSVYWMFTKDHDTWKFPETLFLARIDQNPMGTDIRPLLHCKGFGTRGKHSASVDLEPGQTYAVRETGEMDAFILDYIEMTFAAIPKDWEEFRMRGKEKIDKTNPHATFRHSNSSFDYIKIHARKEKYTPFLSLHDNVEKTDSLSNWTPCVGNAIIKGRIYGGIAGNISYKVPSMRENKSYPRAKKRQDINPDKGEFFIELPHLVRPEWVTVSMPYLNHGYPVFVRPGDEIIINIDANQMVAWNQKILRRRKKAGEKPFCVNREFEKNSSIQGGLPEINKLWKITQEWTQELQNDVKIARERIPANIQEYAEAIWKKHITRQKESSKRKYTPAQREYLNLLSEWLYIAVYSDFQARHGKSETSSMDPHAKDLQIIHSRKGAYVVQYTALAWHYLERNNLLDTPLGRWLNDLDTTPEQLKRGDKEKPMKNNLTDS